MGILDWIYPKKCLGCRANGGYFCQRCQRLVRRRGSGLAYQGIVRRAIKEIKYRGTYDLVAELVEIWAPKRPEGEIVVTSVPMWEGKKRLRGYNQAELIARAVARRWGVEYHELLTRTRKTKPMYGLKKGERLVNVKGAFVYNSQIPNSQVLKYNALILIDDVWTSGATIRECVRVLKQAGWARVVSLALAS